ncbi:TetR/AcrR family transcriptional regulator [Oceanospirillum sediminis]|uniref:TetR/AcrR family transcriptional regulator n=1 Tax=Oceanospirillum sediminis TaxID=2760088 RepID=A0A839ILA0_9GAMM|nr:TetR/AcrR family transcriptional regulator [Oceanospirillum sediminis]MBB1485267.1 TetR/AcrR family transcriptional regulator [Oceanospirillum sediminis]
MNKNNNSSTAERILDVAQDLLQRNGYNGFSYQDIAHQVEIRKASIHYHFPSKSDLVIRLCERYTNQFTERLVSLDQKYDDSLLRIRELTRFFARMVRDKEKLCPMTMLTAEIEALPPNAKGHLQRFVQETESWLERTLEYGSQHKQLSVAGSYQAQSRLMLAAIQGAMLLSRATGQKSHYQGIADNLLSQLRVTESVRLTA